MRHLVAMIVALTFVAGQGAQTVDQRREITAEAVVVGAGGLVYVPGLQGIDAEGKLVGPDVASQTRRILDRMGELLDASGSSLRQAVSVSVFLRDPADLEVLNTTYREYFRESPPVRTTVVSELLGSALVEMSAIAVPVGATREVLHPAGWVKSPRPYSYIVRTDDLVFLSGLVSRRGSDDSLVAGSVAVQTATILDNATTLLKTAGVGLGPAMTYCSRTSIHHTRSARSMLPRQSRHGLTVAAAVLNSRTGALNSCCPMTLS
jgi:2-iminobutanoate/2-iminopropanoate deaminase